MLNRTLTIRVLSQSMNKKYTNL
ncbi:Bgt-4042 [Blumeria graminis f. sp. tritici]|uniref:Bgt-4042 n=1 Tax=Blumeria graminis f. sp. tritici TaxID=62690 RepID=A0A9X9MF44_BLUGR|nr:Bgt-4042 [Blumeria graminis f. sp. tritici]